MSLSVCPGWGIDLQERKKWQIPEGVRGEGAAWLQVKLNHVIGNRWIIFFQNRQESDRATFKFIFTIPRTDRSGYRPCPSTDMIVLKHHFILHESPRRPSVCPLETTESVHSSAAYLCEKIYICEYQNSCWGLRPCPHESVLI